MAKFGNLPLWKRFRALCWGILSVILLIFWSNPAWAGVLSDRISTFPQWSSKPPVQLAVGDLGYPPWLAGTWEVSSTLVDLAAPLAPAVVTPGFDSNRQYLGQPVQFQVRFAPMQSLPTPGRSLQDRSAPLLPRFRSFVRPTTEIVADRAFNGLNVAKAYLGDRAVLAVKVDPSSPNRQITLLPGDRQLTSTVTGRATETPDPDRFITTEVFQQQFRGGPQVYFNEVETTTSYHRIDSGKITADQITAIYLSPQDPNYFKAGDRPVALYRYQLEFIPSSLP